LPIRTANGAVIYMRDVAFVHDGNPPQTNVVHVDGQNAVLLSIIKSGANSTLSVISGVKDLLPQIRNTLPAGLKLLATGDQSVFVTDAVSSVVREGVIAAALTGLMILLFLGSWRSTLIITVSIPLSILAAMAALAGFGQTINVMTLGGLALAVGILVDDATVTIENINVHLERGLPVREAVIRGTEEVTQPAFVALLCISIAFAPMLLLTGVPGSLFLPLAEAVVFALIASFILSRTLVPAMADWLIHEPAHGEAPRGAFTRFQQGFEARFAVVHACYLGLLDLALANARKVILGFLGFSLLSLLLVPQLGQDFFPRSMAVRSASTCAPRPARGSRKPPASPIGQRRHPSDPAPWRGRGRGQQLGLSVSGINMAYDNSGTIGNEDATIQITLSSDHGDTADYVKQLREQLPRRFPGVEFDFLPADMVSQILNFGTPAPIDLQIVGSDTAANRAYATMVLARMKAIPGIADAHIQQAFQQPQLDVNVDRSFAGMVGLTEKDAADAC
jgi:multidrug efflux pump subunit AcrB